MEKTIEFNLDKNKILKLVKKAILSKFGILKDSGFTLKVGAPMMTATIEILDHKTEIKGGGWGKIVAETCYSAIKSEIEDAEENQSNNNSSSPFDDEYKCLQIIISYKKLYDEGIIKEDFYNKKVKKYLKILNQIESPSITSTIVEEAIIQRENPEKWTCPICGRENRDYDEYCLYCLEKKPVNKKSKY